MVLVVSDGRVEDLFYGRYFMTTPQVWKELLHDFVYESGILYDNPNTKLIHNQLSFLIHNTLTQQRHIVLKEAADLVKTWHIKKGGLSELEYQIRNLAKEKP